MTEAPAKTLLRRKADASATRKRVLVLGWYDHGNSGDEAFRESFPVLWPGCDFSFADRVPDGANEAFDAAMIGGGSFLDSGIQGIEQLELPLAFVGVGAGKQIRPAMRDALRRAKAIVLRDAAALAHMPPDLAAEPIVAADLVWARHAWPSWFGASTNKVTVILSEHFVPRGDCPEWVAASWTWFSRELAQALDKLAGGGFQIQFMPMSTTRAWDDRRAAAAIISRMTRAQDVYWHYRRQILEAELLASIAESRVVISQRLHGAIFAAAIGCPFVPVIGHDKMQGFADEAGAAGIPYYALSARALEAVIRAALAVGTEAAAAGSTPYNAYKLEAQKRWVAASAAVTAALSL